MKVIVIGGGPSGMMSAIYAAQSGHKVVLIERNNALGRKLLATGNRRCNITNNRTVHEHVDKIHNGRFLYSTFSQFDVTCLIKFFSDRNLEFHEEDDHRMYPITNKSSDVLAVLEKEIESLDIEVRLNSTVDDIIMNGSSVSGVKVNGHELMCDHLIVASGGLSFPIFGSDGLTHEILKKHDVEITDTYPSEIPLLSNDLLVTSLDLVCLSLKDISLTVLNKNKKSVYSTRGDIIFTHHGLSGPAALKSGEYVYHLLQSEPSVKIRLELMNTLNQKQFEDYLKGMPNETLRKALLNYLPKRLTDYIIKRLKLDSSVIITQLSKRTLETLYSLLYRLDIHVNGVERMSKAIVTGGGVALNQVDSKTLKHNNISNLSLCGEVLDLHGPIGGYNLTIAFTTGMMAGSSI